MRVAAVDLGATSARVAVVTFGDAGLPTIDVVHRCAHAPVRRDDGSLRWDWGRLMREVERGLARALDDGPLASIGVDTWGVDYGLLDATGELIAPPFSYRDNRTDGWRAVVDRIGAERLYATTGVQLMAINTIFQLAAHRRDELDRAATLLLLPELVVYHLTGVGIAERTSAATTGLVSLATDTWDAELLAAIDVDPDLFPPIAPPGTPVGGWRDVAVQLVGGHDTASAVRARQGRADPSCAFVATGTWVLVGVEIDAPILTDAARTANFSHERSVDGRYRLLKNVTGLYLLERCRADWGNMPVEGLVAMADQVGAVPLFDPDDPSLASAADTPMAIAALTGIAPNNTPVMTRSIIESVAAKVALVVAELATVTGVAIESLDVLGGGMQNLLLIRALQEHTGLPVHFGFAEATALGNALTQYGNLRA